MFGNVEVIYMYNVGRFAAEKDLLLGELGFPYNELCQHPVLEKWLSRGELFKSS